MAKRMIAVLLVTVLACFSLAGLAQAQTPAQDAYGGALGEQVSNGPGSSGSEPRSFTATTNRNSLPFTGADLGLAGVLGLGLIGIGVTMRRTTRRQPL